MTIIADYLDEKLDDRYHAEYTTKCGWIDWSHANPDRMDLPVIWSQLPHTRKSGQKPVDLDTYYLEDPNRKKRNAIEYYKVKFTIDQNKRQRKWARWRNFPRTYTFFVREMGKKHESWYKRAALQLFQMSCWQTESFQLETFDFLHKSGFSMDDLASNMMAFYAHVEGMSKTEVIANAGGWTDPEVAREKSKKVFKAMEAHGVADEDKQPKNKFFQKAYLFNDISDVGGADKRGGWHLLPDEFSTIEPILWQWGDVAPANIVMSGQKPKKKTARAPVNRRDKNRFLAQQQMQRQPTGSGRGSGRLADPLGRA